MIKLIPILSQIKVVGNVTPEIVYNYILDNATPQSSQKYRIKLYNIVNKYIGVYEDDMLRGFKKLNQNQLKQLYIELLGVTKEKNDDMFFI